MKGALKPYLALLGRDLRLLAGRGSEALATLFFFAVVASLFPFAFGADSALLKAAAPGVVWVAALLAGLLALEAVYARDFDDGTLDLVLMSPLSAPGIVFAKMTAHWLLSGFLLIPGSFLIGLMLSVPPGQSLVLSLSLAPGTLYMSLLGGMGALLTTGSRRSGLLLAVLVLPLLVPMLILGVMAAEAALAGLPYKAYVLLQLALCLAALGAAPPAGAAFLKMHLRSS